MSEHWRWLGLGAAFVGAFVYVRTVEVDEVDDEPGIPQVLEITPLVLSFHQPVEDAKYKEAILECPSDQTTRRIADNLQKYGFCVVDDLFPPDAHKKISEEVQEIIKEEMVKDESSPSYTIEPREYLDAVITSISEIFMERLNTHMAGWHERHDWDNVKSVFWHQPIVFSEFTGFQSKQLRLRKPGVGLDKHVDRASAKLTVLYYPNLEWAGGELVAYVPPPWEQDSKFDEKFQQCLKSLSGLCPVVIEPKGNRLLVFWSDSIPHEVREIKAPRVSFQVFFSGEHYEYISPHAHEVGAH